MDIFSDSSLQYETYVKSHTFTIKLQTVTQKDCAGPLWSNLVPQLLMILQEINIHYIHPRISKTTFELNWNG